MAGQRFMTSIRWCALPSAGRGLYTETNTKKGFDLRLEFVNADDIIVELPDKIQPSFSTSWVQGCTS